MKRHWLHKIAAAALTGVMTLSLAACGSGTGAGQPSGTSQTPGGGQAASGGNASGDAVEVEFWHYHSTDNQQKAIQEKVDEYNALQNDIHINVTYVARPDLMNQLTIGAVSGELPDICVVDSPDMPSYIQLGVFADVTDKMKAWEGYSHLYPGPLASCTGTDGQIYGMPNNSNCLALVCNMDMLRAAGFDNPPTTWDEFYDICKATSGNGVYGFCMSAISTEEGTFQIIPWINSAGGSIKDIESADVAHAMEFLKQLIDENLMTREVVNYTQSDGYNEFCAGKAAMFESGTWQLATIGNDAGFEYQYVLLPKDKTYASTIGGENYGITVACKAPDACWEFLSWMHSAENNGWWANVCGRIPIRDDGAQYVTNFAGDERYEVFLDGMNYAMARGPHPQWTRISEAVRTAAQQIMLGEKDTATALQEAGGVINPILEETPLP